VEAVVLEDGDDHLPESGLVVVDAAAVEIDDASAADRAPVPLRPALEGPAREPRHRRVAVNAEQTMSEEP
jgi:hypothetical protein